MQEIAAHEALPKHLVEYKTQINTKTMTRRYLSLPR